MKFSTLAILILLPFFAYAQPSLNVIPAELPVNFETSSSGAFTYSLPVEIPPGIRDMVPTLSINYSSQSGVGNMGMGWSLGGLSTISRIPPTIFHNQSVEPVNFGVTDKFSLDGQRLIQTSSNVFMTEHKNFAIIIGYGISGQTPDSFLVTYPSGLKYYYGNTANSRRISSGGADVVLWALSRVEDPHGNYIDLTYYNNQSTGQFRISQIEYGNNLSLSLATNKIKFNYALRNDFYKGYIYGHQVCDSALLNNIQIFHADGSMAQSYGFTYQYDLYPQLTEIYQYKDANTILPPIKIDWGKKKFGYVIPNEETAETSIPTNLSLKFNSGDYNADGATDVTMRSGSALVVYKSDKQDDFTQTSTISYGLPIHEGYGSEQELMFDYNGDGYDDMLITDVKDFSPAGYAVFRIKLFLANGTGGFNPGTYIFEYSNNHTTGSPNPYLRYIAGIRCIPGNYDGDGKTDLVLMIPDVISGTSSTAYPLSYKIYLLAQSYTPAGSTSVGTYGTITYGNYVDFALVSSPIYNSIKLDYNGDGKDDLLLTRDVSGLSNCVVFSVNASYNAGGSPTIVSTSLLYSGSYPSAYDRYIYPGDFNGDGKDDILTCYQFNPSNPVGTWDIGYSTGNGANGWDRATSGLTSPLFVGMAVPTSETNYQVADFNGDGKADILRTSDGGGTASDNYSLFYSSGYENFTLQTGTVPSSFVGASCSAKFYLGDFNGDCRLDVLNISTCHNKAYICYFRKCDISQLVTSVEHAGKRIDIEYKTLSEYGDHYSFVPWSINGHTQTEYPYVSKQLPIKVVTSMADNIDLNTSYKYQTISLHTTGLGFQGFKKMFVTDLVDGKIAENEFSLFPFHGTVGNYLRAPIHYKSSRYLLDSFNAGIFNPYNTVENSYIDINGDPSGKSRIVLRYATIKIDKPSGSQEDLYISYNTTSSTTSMTYQFGQPDFIVTANGLHNGYVYDTTTFTYDVGAPFHYKEKPIAVRKAVQYPGQPKFTTRTEVTYDSKGMQLTKKTSVGRPTEVVTSYGYNNVGNLISELHTPTVTTDAPIRSVNYAYTSDERFKQSETFHLGSNNYVESFEYNNWGYKTKATAATGLITTYVHDKVNRVTKITDPTGIILETFYDWAYRDNIKLPMSYNPTSLFTDYNVITQNQNAAQFYCANYTGGLFKNADYIDFYKRNIRTVKPAFSGIATEAILEDIVYNNKGLVSQRNGAYPQNSPSLSLITNYSYDEFHREVSRSGAQQPTFTTTYVATVAPAKLTTVVTNTSAPTTQQKVTDVDFAGTFNVLDNGVQIATVYGSNGKPLEVVVNNDINLKTTYEYYDDGLLKSVSEPNTGTTTYEYNAYGWLTKEKDANNVTYKYAFDDLGRITSKTQQGTSNVYTYTFQNTPGLPATGKLLTESSPYGTQTDYAYDTYGRLQTETETIPGQSPLITSYTYDALSRISTHAYPAGDVIQYKYNAQGYLEKVDLIGGPTIYQINSKNHLNQVLSSKYFSSTGGNLYLSNKMYDGSGRLMTQEFRNGNFPPFQTIQNCQYAWDYTTGNLTSRTNFKFPMIMAEIFTYDEHNRLETVTKSGTISGPVLTMDYNSVGNIIKKDDVTATNHLWKYNKYALTVVAEPASSTPSYRIPTNTQLIDYYPFKKIKSLHEVKDQIDFIYNARNQRAKAEYYNIPSGITYLTKTRYYANKFERTVNAVTGIIENASYVYADGIPIAVIYRKTGAPRTWYYLVTDHLGSLTHIVDNIGTGSSMGVVEERSFDAWGRPRDPMTYNYFAPTVTPTWMFDRGYTGHEHIWLQGSYDNCLINMNGRLYDPLVGRMLSADPVLSDATNSQAYNKYSYAYNNPLAYTDPSGNTAFPLTGVLSGGFGSGNSDATFGQQLLYVGIMVASSYVGGAVAGILPAAFGQIGSYGIRYATQGFVMESSSAWISGANLSDGLKAGLRGAGDGLAIAGAGLVLNAANGGIQFSGSGAGRRGKSLHFDDNSKTIKGLPINPTLPELVKFIELHFPELAGLMKDQEVVINIVDNSQSPHPDTYGDTHPASNDWTKKTGVVILNFYKRAFTDQNQLWRTIRHELYHYHQIRSGFAAEMYNRFPLLSHRSRIIYMKSELEVPAFEDTILGTKQNGWHGFGGTDSDKLENLTRERDDYRLRYERRFKTPVRGTR